jgi:hypothetical protein
MFTCRKIIRRDDLALIVNALAIEQRRSIFKGDKNPQYTFLWSGSKAVSTMS